MFAPQIGNAPLLHCKLLVPSVKDVPLQDLKTKYYSFSVQNARI